MADNYIERCRDNYETRKQLWLQKQNRRGSQLMAKVKSQRDIKTKE